MEDIFLYTCSYCNWSFAEPVELCHSEEECMQLQKEAE